jgi:type I restriction enzyme S subunit
VSFPRYPRYKESGVEWLGEVPDHWQVKRLRFVAELNPAKAEIAELEDGTVVSFLPMEAIGDDGSLDLCRERQIAEVKNGYTYFRDGDVTVAKITPCFENGKGAVMRGLTNGIGFGTTELVVARPRPGQVTSEYLHLLFTSGEFRQIGESWMYGAGGQKRVPDDFVRDFTTAFPPLSEQSSISEFLLKETASIHKLVAEQQRLLELLREKRQAIISHAVTKGVNQRAPMKRSGVEWLGDIPAHWELKRLKNTVVPVRGIQMGPFGGMLKDLRTTPTAFKLYGQENTISNDFDAGSRWLSQEHFDSLRDYELLPGDLVLTRKGASIGHCRVVPVGIQPGVIDSDTIRVRLDASLMSTSFASLLMHEGYMEAAILERQKGAVLPGLNSRTIENLPVALPPIHEQNAIMNFLAVEVSKVDGLVMEARAAIDLLQERRTALISAAVTGKIDVRELAGANTKAA